MSRVTLTQPLDLVWIRDAHGSYNYDAMLEQYKVFVRSVDHKISKDCC